MIIKIRNVPDEVWHKFKIACVKKNVSCNNKLIELIKQEVARQEKKKKD